MKLTPEQQKERDAILADMEAMRLRVNALFTPKVQPTWPQYGDKYICIISSGEVSRESWTSDECHKLRLAIGNVIHPSKQAELERHIEALKVHHELRSMPGRTAPPNGDGCAPWCIIRQDAGSPFKSINYSATVAATLALGGVWFGAKEWGDNAIEEIGQERLTILYDDFLQTPMGE